jgi:hypothetical protein
LYNCPVCNTANSDFAVRCVSCGSILQQAVKTIDLFSTVYNLWRYPDLTFRKIVIAEHKNYVLFISILEGIALSFLFMFIVKAGDIYSIDLPRLLYSGFVLAILIFLPFLFLFSAINYIILGVSKLGVTLRGFVTAVIFGLHPIAVSALIILPSEIAVFGGYFFSNNPSPRVINPLPFYFLNVLDIVLACAAFVFIVKLSNLLFGTRKYAAVFVVIFFIFLYAAMYVAKKFLLGH